MDAVTRFDQTAANWDANPIRLKLATDVAAAIATRVPP
ncbi:MAG: hypothetical protein BWY87_00905 [Deltaproteobacteria bacterium ADurb.Bin510]|jgi:hypothetical protein|nr:MAG: hypothetical protein BWY87_00905 [Deltaproteobacteria bacterium ADurb.Bin510]